MQPQQQQQGHKAGQQERPNYLRLYVLYPLIWIVVSVILFYLVKLK